MSDLKKQVQTAVVSAMKAGEKKRLGTVRLITSAIKQVEVDERIELDDARIIAILDKMVKQRRESISQFKTAGRDDLVDHGGGQQSRPCLSQIFDGREEQRYRLDWH